MSISGVVACGLCTTRARRCSWTTGAPRPSTRTRTGIASRCRCRSSFLRAAPSKEFCNRLKAADAFMIAAPEYNTSMPGTLKNSVD
jgi:hypothetical protein